MVTARHSDSVAVEVVAITDSGSSRGTVGKAGNSGQQVALSAASGLLSCLEPATRRAGAGVYWPMLA